MGGGGLKKFGRKGEVKEKCGGGRGDLSRNGGLPCYTEVFMEIPHDAA